jgi:glyoxylase-like metal-dependent hydrolase (beta-lactamase superfamily II)
VPAATSWPAAPTSCCRATCTRTTSPPSGSSPGPACSRTQWVLDQFHFEARPDTGDFGDGDVFDLGGVAVRVFHAPGHTRGHSVLRVEPEGVLFLGDIDLSSFGPYYGDAWSNLADFEATLAMVKDIEASAWVSFHHVGVIEDRAGFLARLERFTAKIGEREAAILAFVAAPRSLDEMVARRFLYPSHAAMPFIDAVEKRTTQQHLERLRDRGAVEEIENGRWVARA